MTIFSVNIREGKKRHTSCYILICTKKRRSDFYYGGGNFCSLNCYNDWAEQFIDRAVDMISGRLHEPITLTEENAWQRTYNRGYWDDNTLPRYIERNMLTGEERPCQQDN